MQLPNPDNAIIDERKLVGYCLNLNHPDGQHKARVFKSALGLGSEDVEVLKAALMAAVKNNDATPDKQNAYGQKYVIDFPMTYQGKTATVHSVWMVRDNENIPRLVTCYIL